MKKLILILGLLMIGLLIAGCKTCSDTDNGKNIYQEGTLTGLLSNGQEATVRDYCHDGDPSKQLEEGTQVSEYFCLSGGKYSRENVEFPLGCIDGACK